MAISKKQKNFCHEYIRDFNATQAAIRAGYSPRSAKQQGSRLLTKDDLLEYLGSLIEEVKMTPDEVVIRLSEIARSSPETFLTFEGNTWKVDIPKAKRENKMHLIKSITPTRYGPKIELLDPLKALEMIGRYHTLFTDKLKVETWRDEVVDLLKSGKINPDQVVEELGNDLATELFKSAGIPVTAERES